LKTLNVNILSFTIAQILARQTSISTGSLPNFRPTPPLSRFENSNPQFPQPSKPPIELRKRISPKSQGTSPRLRHRMRRLVPPFLPADEPIRRLPSEPRAQPASTAPPPPPPLHSSPPSPPVPFPKPPPSHSPFLQGLFLKKKGPFTPPPRTQLPLLNPSFSDSPLLGLFSVQKTILYPPNPLPPNPNR